MTTNHLAKRSCYSVGTVYQYFPNRESVVLALIERQRDTVEQRIEALLDERCDHGWEAKVRGIVQLFHEAFDWHRATDPRLMRSLMQLAVVHGLPEPGEGLGKAIVYCWMSEGRHGERTLNPAEIFVLTRAVLEVFRFATLQSSPLLGTQVLEDAIFRLIRGFFATKTRRKRAAVWLPTRWLEPFKTEERGHI